MRTYSILPTLGTPRDVEVPDGAERCSAGALRITPAEAIDVTIDELEAVVNAGVPFTILREPPPQTPDEVDADLKAEAPEPPPAEKASPPKGGAKKTGGKAGTKKK